MESFAAVAASAELHITWALSLLGASVATIVGTSHVSPARKLHRAIYLLFVPAWISLACSIWHGDLVARGRLAAFFGPDKRGILQAMNSDYNTQQWTLMLGVGFFTSWLALYLLWWIFVRPHDTKGT